jgi:hypothetical protein
MRPVRVLTALLVLAGVFPVVAQAQEEDSKMAYLKDGTGIDRDATTYRLTKQVMPRFAAALREVAALRKSDPSAMAGGPAEVPPRMRAIFTAAKITPEEWSRFFSTALASYMVGEVSDNTAAYPILNENIRFVKANAAAMKGINADMASMMGDFEVKK